MTTFKNILLRQSMPDKQALFAVFFIHWIVFPTLHAKPWRSKVNTGALCLGGNFINS
jgi:hypothetical protein